MKGRYILTGLLLLLLFTAAVSQTLHDEDIVEDLPSSFDIVVAGSGLPALTAALQASLLGAEVMLLNHQDLRDEFFPPLGGRFVAFAPEEEEEGEGEELPEGNRQLLYSIMEASPGIQTALLADLLLEGRDTLEWLSRETGLSFPFAPEDPHHSYAPPFRNPEALLTGVEGALAPRLAAEIPGGKPLEILASAAGQVEGVRYQDASGREHTVTTRSVILAPGGYLGHRDFMEAHSLEAASLPLKVREAGISGTAYELTRPFRVLLANPERVYMPLFLYPREVPIREGDFVNLSQGDWFTGQGEEVTSEAVEALTAGEDALQKFVLSKQGELLLVYPEGREWELPGLVYAGSIRDLAEITDIPQGRLEEIAARRPLPYYIGWVAPVPLYSLGGIATDARGRVLGATGALPGFYALGEAAGGLHGQGVYPGLPLTEALVMGRRVGREAALYSRR